MRTLKFRTWDTQNKEFSEWTNRDPFFSTSDGAIFFWERRQKPDGSFDGDIVLQDTGERFVLQQYTGLKDSKGKEIFEGDILVYESSKTPCAVRWSNEDEDNHPGFRMRDLLCQYGPCSIIGNIFETPEILCHPLLTQPNQ